MSRLISLEGSLQRQNRSRRPESSGPGGDLIYRGNDRVISDVLPYRLLVPPYSGYEISPGPEVLAYEASFPLPVDPGQVDRTLSLEDPTT